MGLGTTRSDRGVRLIWAVGILLGVCAGDARAQLFNLPTIRPPADIPGQNPPVQNLAPPAESAAPAPAAPRGPTLQSLPPAGNPAPSQAQRPSGTAQAQLALAARYGSDLPQITGGLHWRIYPV